MGVLLKPLAFAGREITQFFCCAFLTEMRIPVNSPEDKNHSIFNSR